MISLNLIPEKAKQELLQKHHYELLSTTSLLLFIIITLLTIPLLVGNIILENKFISTVDQITQVTLQPHTDNFDITEINTKMKKILDFQKDYIPWSRLLVSLSSHAPEGVVFKSLQASHQEKSMLTITGRAAKRDNFILLKNNLDSDELFTSVSSPIGNLLEQENIDFTLHLNLNLEML